MEPWTRSQEHAHRLQSSHHYLVPEASAEATAAGGEEQGCSDQGDRTRAESDRSAGGRDRRYRREGQILPCYRINRHQSQSIGHYSAPALPSDAGPHGKTQTVDNHAKPARFAHGGQRADQWNDDRSRGIGTNRRESYVKERTLFAKDMEESWSVLLTLPLVGNFCCERVFVTAVAAEKMIRWIYCSNRTLSIKSIVFYYIPLGGLRMETWQGKES